MLTANEIRQQFIDFFVKKHAHTFVPSSPVVPHDDPTLLFTNAGMNQFKDVFLGTGTGAYKRAANTQKCIRAGGKHNDLDDVGKDTYHHTFFEMLGNWSFGDYFKKEAIRWAWELLTEVWKLDKTRLHATVFEGDKKEDLDPDNEAAALWRSETDIDPTHIHLGNKKDNFWEMGDTGPCGPCTEIHIDRTPGKTGGHLVNAGTPEVMEIWNLVFIQFNRGPDKKLTPLPAKHVDTGMGFERVTSVLQGKNSNYDTDVFTPIFAAIQEVTGARPYGGVLEDIIDTAYRVIADHIRMLTFALTDGAVPDNEGRGSVLRSVLRRAERYGKMYLDIKEPFLYRLVPAVVNTMASAFPELQARPDKVAKIILDEEKSFFVTLERGINLFQKVAERTRQEGGKIIRGADAFDLHTTYGFYIEITEQMASEVGLSVDRASYKRLYVAFRETSGKDRKKSTISAIKGSLPETNDSAKYTLAPLQAQVLGWIKEDVVYRDDAIPSGQEVGLLLDKTNFYPEQGGQVGDKGQILWSGGTFRVTDTQRIGSGITHVGTLASGSLAVGQNVQLEVDSTRADIMRNHTATHLLNWALRRVLGDHIDQKGSLVDAEKTRFDFTHDKPITSEEITEVEKLVNARIIADVPVGATMLPLEQARKLPGVRAVFGEKYPDPVRVLTIGTEVPSQATVDDSIEFCGGTHLHHTGEAGLFKIISQEGVAKGVRRLTAVTGRGALAVVQQQAAVLDTLCGRFNCKPEDLTGRVEALQEEMRKLQTALKKSTATDLAGAADRLLAEAKTFGEAHVIVGELPAAPLDQMRIQLDRLRTKAKSAVIVVGWVEEGKVTLLAAVTEDLTKKGLEAGKLIGEVAKVVGGKGGGRKEMAQAGGPDASKLDEALALARKLAGEKLGT